MLAEAAVQLHSTSVGMMRVDSARIQGEGGSAAPRLVVPLAIELFQRPKDQRLALLRIEAALWLAAHTQNVQLGPKSLVFGDGGGQNIWHTYESHAFQATADLHFPLTQELLRLIEQAAHALAPRALGLALILTPIIALVRGVEGIETPGMPGQVNLLGHAFDLLPFSWSGQGRLEIQIGREQWATEIGPALGLDELRMVAVRLPQRLEGLDRRLVASFDEGVGKYERGDYRGAVQIGRDISELVRASLAETGQATVAEAIASDRGVGADSAPIQFADAAWKLLADVTNAAHHSRSVGAYTSADARAVLLVVAVLLEHAADSFRRSI